MMGQLLVFHLKQENKVGGGQLQHLLLDKELGSARNIIHTVQQR